MLDEKPALKNCLIEIIIVTYEYQIQRIILIVDTFKRISPFMADKSACFQGSQNLLFLYILTLNVLPICGKQSIKEPVYANVTEQPVSSFSGQCFSFFLSPFMRGFY